MKVFCIIPAFNEEKKIESVLGELKTVVDEIVVVDDCSSDDTSLKAKKTGVTVLKHVVNRGQGAALQTGNLYALNNGAQIIAHFDGDGQFMVNDLKKAITLIKKEDYDVILGSRFLGKESNMPFLKKKILFPVARIFNKVFFNIILTDPQSGFRIMKRKVAEQIKIENDGSAHCSEILHKIFKNKFSVKEMPIKVVYHEFGQSFFGGKGSGKGGLRIVKDLILQKIIQ